MAETTRFGFEKVGGSFGGSIADNGGKYTTTDRDTFDKLLAFFENHKHDGGTDPVALASPTAAATATISPTGGTIPNGTTRYYKYSLIDQFGLESAASPELAVALPALVTVTDAPVVTGATVGGSTLPSGVTYYYALTGVTLDGETELGPESVITVQTGQNQVNAVLPTLPTGVTSWNLWRMAVTDEGWTKVGSALAGGATFNDTGIATGDCLCDPTTQPPTTALAASGASSITITPADLTGAVSWRLYESDTSGFYDSASLVAAIVPTVVGDPPPTSYLDTGAALLTGQPLRVSTTVTPSHAVAGGGGGSGGGGADSHWVSDLSGQVPPTTSGDSHPVYVQGAALDVVGNDIVAVYELSGDTTGDELQIDTDAVYSFFGRITVNGAVAGDQFVVEANWVAGGPSSLSFLPIALGAVIIPPGQTTGESSWAMPPIFIPKGTRISFSLVSWIGGAAPDEILVSIGAAMASGSPASAEVYPAPAAVATAVSGHDHVDVTWTNDPADAEYHVLCYDHGGLVQPVGKDVNSTGTGTSAFTGLIVGHSYDVIVLGHKTIDGIDLFSTAAIASASLQPANSFFFEDDFNRADGGLNLPDWITGVGDPAGVMGVASNALSNTGTGGVAYALRSTARAAKWITFTHAAPTGGAAVVAVLASDFALNNPRCLLTIDPTAVTAPTLDYYDSGGTHTAIPMTAVGAGLTAYDGSTATLRATIHGDQVMLYQGGTLVAVATIPAAIALNTDGVGLNPSATGGTIDDFQTVAYSSVASGGSGGSQQFSAGGSTYAAELLPVDEATAGRIGVVALYGKQSAPTLDGFTQLFEQHDGAGYLSLWWKVFDGSESGGLQVYAQAAPFVGVMKSYGGMTTATGSGATGDTTPTETVAIGDAIFSVVGSVCATADNGGGNTDPNIGGENAIPSTDNFLYLSCGDEDSAIAGTSEPRTITSGGTTPTYSAATVVIAP